MYKFLAILIVSLTILSNPAYAFADDMPSITVGVTQKPEPDHIDDDPVRHRSRAKIIFCTISPYGVDIPSVAPEEVISYEVCSTEGDCIASFSSEMDFVSFLYGVSGTFEIRIHIEGYVFIGFISL